MISSQSDKAHLSHWSALKVIKHICLIGPRSCMTNTYQKYTPYFCVPRNIHESHPVIFCIVRRVIKLLFFNQSDVRSRCFSQNLWCINKSFSHRKVSHHMIGDLAFTFFVSVRVRTSCLDKKAVLSLNRWLSRSKNKQMCAFFSWTINAMSRQYWYNIPISFSWRFLSNKTV